MACLRFLSEFMVQGLPTGWPCLCTPSISQETKACDNATWLLGLVKHLVTSSIMAMEKSLQHLSCHGSDLLLPGYDFLLWPAVSLVI